MRPITYDLKSDGKKTITVSKSGFPLYFIHRDKVGWYVMPNKVGRMSSRATHERVRNAIRPYLKGEIADAIERAAAEINWARTPEKFYRLDRGRFRLNADISHDTVALIDGVVYWCRDQFGRPSVRRWEFCTVDGFGMFVFADDAMATAFRMRWC